MSSDVELWIQSRPREIEPGVSVGRVLPAAERRQVGPYVFLDHMGPQRFAAGHGADVRPHPHIGLATVTYLFEGEITHRDSAGSLQNIRPGAVNWMSAGAGIAHSERTPPELRATGGTMHGLQLWVGLPQKEETSAAWFRHYPAESLPQLDEPGARLRVLAGEAFGVKSPVQTSWPSFQVDATLDAGAPLKLPEGFTERALYVVSGALALGSSERIEKGTMAVFRAGTQPALRAESAARVMMLGGEPLDGPRFIFWNFVNSSKERIVEAARRWKAGGFTKVKGDETEYVPLTLEPRFPSH